MTPERLAELRSKVEHGYNLINSEAREVLEHFGVAVEHRRKRCCSCDSEGIRWLADESGRRTRPVLCGVCNGSGYEVRK